MTTHLKKPSSGAGTVTKEFLIGLLAIVWGGYNLLSTFEVIPKYVDTSNIQVIGNILLILAGFFLWITAYKLWRVKWHSRGIL